MLKYISEIRHRIIYGLRFVVNQGHGLFKSKTTFKKISVKFSHVIQQFIQSPGNARKRKYVGEFIVY